MSSDIVVDAALYRRIQQAEPNEEVVGYVHLHTKMWGACEIKSGGRKPIKCNLTPCDPSRNARRGSKNGRHQMIFTKK